MLQPPVIVQTDHLDQGTNLRQTLSCLIPTFLNAIKYVPPREVDKKALRISLLDRALQSGVHLGTDDASQMRFEAGLAVAAEMYPLHPFEIQIHIGLFTWYGFIIDDMNAELGQDLEQFQTRLLMGEQQPSALLQAFADVLKMTKKYYDPIVANLIVLSALAFVNSNAIEIRPQYHTIVLSKETVSWPYYFRDKEGLPEVYTYFCFYKETCPDIACFLPAAPEMGKFINLTNDILSFYKEEKAGEVRNYIHKQASSLNQSPLSILESAIMETVVAYNRSRAILKNSHPLRVFGSYRFPIVTPGPLQLSLSMSRPEPKAGVPASECVWISNAHTW
ncbi:squalene synthase [Colletotrichum acutatum]|uniref:Squalene synthase n=1 Tax=Glomerella acutata TaxID=27357 RepID=A0AAD8UEK1_GLOAC|nr:squalene synthase [Colletotrichum acutatum]KAK1714128.1 squalene synthase [Colletotrichum acutatum]